MLNLVDVNTNSLINSWILIPHISTPTVSKMFEIKLQKGKSSSKRVMYTNPSPHRKVLCLRTDSPHLMQFKEILMTLEANSSQFIGLRFSPCTTLKTSEILIFLNNEFDKVEECLSINITYLDD